jgi:arylsulfatase A-like enzyme
MLRTARYKLVRHYAPHAGVYPDELYDLRADPGETHNRIADTELSAIIAELDGRLEAYFARYEQPERSAKNILSQPLCNNVEPWRIARPV